MRGKAVAHSIITEVHGITPAYAGKRQRRDVFVCKSQDHPRLCGEKIKSPFLFLFYCGSPPPMRGKGQPKTLYDLA